MWRGFGRFQNVHNHICLFVVFFFVFKEKIPILQSLTCLNKLFNIIYPLKGTNTNI